MFLRRPALFQRKVRQHLLQRGVEIIFPYQKGIFKIKQVYTDYPDKQKKELIKFKKVLKTTFLAFLYTKKQDALMQDYQSI